MSINALPVVGWFLSFIGMVSLSIPFWLCWTVWGIGQKFFGFLPEQFLNIGFWNCVGLFMVLSILRGFSPFVVTSSNTNTNK